MAQRSNASPSLFLMPMAFGSLLGGLITLVVTSPNIIVSRIREELTGQSFSMFDFTPVGLGLATAGVALRFSPSDTGFCRAGVGPPTYFEVTSWLGHMPWFYF
jgi:di/tricarboxylate transporter